MLVLIHTCVLYGCRLWAISNRMRFISSAHHQKPGGIASLEMAGKTRCPLPEGLSMSSRAESACFFLD